MEPPSQTQHGEAHSSAPQHPQPTHDLTSLVVHRPEKPQYSIGTRALIVIAFFWMSGGIYGNEEMMLVASAQYVLPALLICPLIYSIPIMMVTTELATALPKEGGSVAWVKEVGDTFVKF
jgi:amino acid transporter